MRMNSSGRVTRAFVTRRPRYYHRARGSTNYQVRHQGVNVTSLQPAVGSRTPGLVWAPHTDETWGTGNLANRYKQPIPGTTALQIIKSARAGQNRHAPGDLRPQLRGPAVHIIPNSSSVPVPLTEITQRSTLDKGVVEILFFSANRSWSSSLARSLSSPVFDHEEVSLVVRADSRNIFSS